MADAVVYATALANTCKLITSDRDLEALPEVTFIPES
jgi:predicted nucleic acid-binding protein